jgi:hypothetical protein
VSLRDLEDNTAASSSEEDNSPSSLTLEEAAFLASPALGFAFAGFDDAVAFTTTALSISSISLSLSLSLSLKVFARIQKCDEVLREEASTEGRNGKNGPRAA